MTTQNLIRLLAGTVTLAGVALAHFVSPWWLLLLVPIGLGLARLRFGGVVEGIVPQSALVTGNSG